MFAPQIAEVITLNYCKIDNFLITIFRTVHRSPAGAEGLPVSVPYPCLIFLSQFTQHSQPFVEVSATQTYVVSFLINSHKSLMAKAKTIFNYLIDE